MIDDVSYTTWLFVSSLGKAGWLQFEAGAHAHIMAQHSTEEMQIILYRAWALGKPRKTQKKKTLVSPMNKASKNLDDSLWPLITGIGLVDWFGSFEIEEPHDVCFKSVFKTR